MSVCEVRASGLHLGSGLVSGVRLDSPVSWKPSLPVLIHKTGIAIPTAHCGDFGVGTLQALSRGLHSVSSASLNSLPFPTPSLGPGSPLHPQACLLPAGLGKLSHSHCLKHGASESQLYEMGCPHRRPQSVTECKNYDS